MYQFSSQICAFLHFTIKLVQQFSRGHRYLSVTNEVKPVTAILNRDAETSLDLFQMGIKGAAKVGELAAVIGFQDDLMRLGFGQVHHL